MDGTVLEKKYYLEKKIYENSYYADYKTWHSSWNEYVLLRKVRSIEGNKAFLKNEAREWIEIGLHPNVMSAYFFKESGEDFYLFIEDVEGKSLASIALEYSTESFPRILETTIQIAQGMEHLHNERIVHRQLLPKNIIWGTNGRIKIHNVRWAFGSNITDIAKGLRPLFSSDSTAFDQNEICKKFAFLPPEYFNNSNFSWIDNFSADVYSFGVLIHYICCRELPLYFEGDLKKIFQYYVDKHKGNIPSLRQKHKYISREFAELVSCCLAKNPKERPNFSEIKKSLHETYENYTGVNYISETFADTYLLSISLNNRAIGEIDNNEKDKAKNILRDVSLLHIDRISAILNLKLLQLRENEISLREFLKTTQKLECIDKSKILLFQGLVCLEHGSFIQDMLDKIQDYDSSNEKMRFVEGCLFYRMGKYKDAFDVFYSLIRKGIKTQELWYFTGASALAINNKQDAFQIWKEGLNYTPPHFDLFLACGIILSSEENWGQVREYFEKGFQNNFLHIETPKTKWSHVRTLDIVDKNKIIELAISEDQKYIIAKTLNETEHIWSWPEGEKQKQPETTDAPIQKTGRIHCNFFKEGESEKEDKSGIIFGDNKKGISIFNGTVIRIWDLSNKVCLHELTGHTRSITSIAVTNNGKTLISGSLDKTVKVWDLEKGLCKVNLTGHSDCINCVDISNDGDIAISGSWDKTVKVWDTLKGQSVATISKHQGDITSLSLSADGALVVSGDACGNVRVLDVPKNKEIAYLQGENKSVTRITLSKDKSLIVAGYVDGNIRVFEDINLRACACWIKAPFLLGKLFDPVSLKKRQEIAFWKDKAENFILNNKIEKALSSYDKVLSSAQESHYLKTLRSIVLLLNKYDIKSKNLRKHKLVSIFYHENGIRDFLILNDECFFSICENSRLHRWQIIEKSCDVFWQKSKYNFSSIAMSKNRKTLFFGDYNNLVHMWLPEVDHWKVLEGHTGIITGLTMVNNLLVSAGSDGTLQFWNNETGEPRGICYSNDYITDLAVTKDKSVIITSSLEGNIRFWETETKKCILQNKKTSGSISQIAILNFAPQTIASCGVDGCIKLWNIRSGTCDNVFQVTTGKALTAMSIAHKQKIALLGSSDGKLYLWDFVKEKVISEIEAHAGKIVKVHISGNGFIGYSAGTDGVIKLWAFEWLGT